MIAAALYLAPSLAALAWLVLAAVVAPRRPFAIAYVHPADVPRFEREGWHVCGQDPRYGSVVMRRDAEDVTAPARSVVLGRGA